MNISFRCEGDVFVFLSIIVPVYNAEKYIEECLNSCLAQDIDSSDYEIVCVNDGSEDNSLDILRKYEKSNTNIVIVNQKNAGVSAARNKGLHSAKGDFVWFVDSDDFIRRNCLGELKELSKNYDIIFFGGYAFNSELNDEEKELLSANKLKANKVYWGYSTFKIYKKSIIADHSISFNADIKYGEDEVFNNDIFEHTDNIFSLEYTNYLYRKNPNSAMNTLLIPENQIKRLESVILSMVILKKGIESEKYTSDFSREFITKRYELVQYCFKRLSIKTARKYFRLMKKQGLFSYKAEKIKNLGLPSAFHLKTTYLKQHFPIWAKAFYKKTRTKIKNMMPKSLVRIIKKIFKMPND